MVLTTPYSQRTKLAKRNVFKEGEANTFLKTDGKYGVWFSNTRSEKVFCQLLSIKLVSLVQTSYCRMSFFYM